MVAGLEEPTEGTVTIGERVVNDVEPKDRNVAMVFQSYALYPHMTVRRNIEFPLRQRGADKTHIATAATEVARSLGLETLLDRKPSQLSGGQRQRVALARAIVRDPLAFLMDEPLSNLDAALRTQTRADIVELQRRLGTTTLYVTHDQVEAMTMADRVAILESGVLKQLGPPQDIYERPADVFVARFIGNPPMNVMETAVATERNGGWSATWPSGSLPLPNPYPGAGAPGTGGEVRRLTVGIRPEHIALSAEGSLGAEVTLIELLGHEVHVLCRSEGAGPFIVRQEAHRPRPRRGESVRVSTRAEHVHLFDPETGRRLEPNP
jgi:ABC-type sugar transport system ATPase subunit